MLNFSSGSSHQIYVTCVTKGKQRLWDKHDACLYCDMEVLSTSFRDHLFNKHENEEKVLEVKNLPIRSSERSRKLQLLRNQGNFRHNLNVLKNGGELILVRRPSSSKKVIYISDTRLYVSCNSCLGTYSKHEFWRHKCPCQSTPKKVKSTKLVSLKEDDKILQVFSDRLLQDEVGNIVMSDSLIRLFVSREIRNKGIKNYSPTAHQARLLAEFVREFRKEVGRRMSLKEILALENSQSIVSVVTKMFNYDSTVTGDAPASLSRPSSFVKMVRVILNNLDLLKVDYLGTGDICSSERAAHLHTVLQTHLTPMKENASKSLQCAKSGLPQELPKASDVSNLVRYLKENLDTVDLIPSNSRTVQLLVLARLLQFNKRRSNEVAGIKTSTWQMRSKWKVDSEECNLSETERILIKRMELCYVKGKGNKYVPILFPPETVKPMSWLAENSIGGFIFGNQGKGHLRGHDALRIIAKMAGLGDKNLNSTKFRKYAATTLQVSLLFYNC